jgi:hypothetical protein
MSPEITEGARPAAELARLPLVLVALEGMRVLADRRFPPGVSVTVGSNSGCDLVVPAKFELTSYSLISQGSKLHLARPLFVQTSVWLGDAAVPLRGFVRDLVRSHPELLEPVPLASERFLVRYATGIALLGRFGEAG